jgi:AhpD family alkylhydroperoxidase
MHPATPRLPFYQLSPGIVKGMIAAGEALKHGPLGAKIVDLVFLRVSLINRCAYCVDLHWRDLVKQDVDPRVLNSISTWDEHDLFTPREAAALHWAELVTHAGETRVPDADFEAMKQHYTDAEITDLTFAVAMMNFWNRVSIAMRNPVPAKA